MSFEKVIAPVKLIHGNSTLTRKSKFIHLKAYVGIYIHMPAKELGCPEQLESLVWPQEEEFLGKPNTPVLTRSPNSTGDPQGGPGMSSVN